MTRRAVRTLAALAALAVAGAWPVDVGAAQAEIMVEGLVVDADGTPVENASVRFSGSYALTLSSGHVTAIAPYSTPRYPGDPDPPSGAPDATTGPDGRFEVELPAGAASRLFDGDRDEGGFSAEIRYPRGLGGPGEEHGAFVHVDTRLRRGDARVSLPTVRAWRPRLATEPVNPVQLRLRWSSLPDVYGREITAAGAAIVATDSVDAVPTGRYAARVDLRTLPARSGWAAVARTQVGSRSNMTYASPVVKLPDGPPPVSTGRPCLVIGTEGSVARGPCLATDGKVGTSPGSVFPQKCPVGAHFCEEELPMLTAVDLGRPVELTLVRADGDCYFRCEVMLSDDGRTWRKPPEPPRRSGCEGFDAAAPVVARHYQPPTGTRARFVAMTSAVPSQIRPVREIGPVPSASKPFDVKSLGITATDVVDAREIAVYTGPAAIGVCDRDELPALAAPPVPGGGPDGSPVSRHAATVRGAAGLLWLLVAAAFVLSWRSRSVTRTRAEVTLADVPLGRWRPPSP